MVGFLSFLYFSTNVAFAHAAETNVWAERRRSAASTKSVAALPAAGAEPMTVLKGLPDIQPAALSQLEAGLPAGALNRYVDLLKSIPSTHGMIRRVSLSSGRGSTVVFLQDVHNNDEGQRNLGGIVASMAAAGKISLVGLEAEFAPLNLEKYRSFENQAAVRMTADHLLKEHQISGPVHTAYTHPGALPPFVGVDDPARYEANIAAYRRSAPKMDGAKYDVALRSHRLSKEKERVFNPALLAFDRAAAEYHRERLPFGSYVSLLSAEAPAGPAGQIALFLRALAMEKALDFSAVEEERSRVIAELVRRLSKVQLDRLLQFSVAYRAGSLTHTDYYRALKDFCRDNGVGLASYPVMDRYIQYVLLSGRINADALFKEVQAAEKATYARLAKTDEEKRLAAGSRRLVLTAKLLDFSLTPDEWAEYKTGGHGAGEDAGLSSFTSFYREAEARNHAMTENLLKAMAGKQDGAAVLVAGGFHTVGMTKLLTERGVSVIEVAPKLTRVDGPASAYLGVFTQEKTPLEQLFKGNKLFVGDRANRAALGHRLDLELAMADAQMTGNPAKAAETYRRFDGDPKNALSNAALRGETVRAEATSPAGRVRLMLTVAGGAITAFTMVMVVGPRAHVLNAALGGLAQGLHFSVAFAAVSNAALAGLPYIAGAALGGVLSAAFRRPLKDNPTMTAGLMTLGVAAGTVSMGGWVVALLTVPAGLLFLRSFLTQAQKARMASTEGSLQRRAPAAWGRGLWLRALGLVLIAGALSIACGDPAPPAGGPAAAGMAGAMEDGGDGGTRAGTGGTGGNSDGGRAAGGKGGMGAAGEANAGGVGGVVGAGTGGISEGGQPVDGQGGAAGSDEGGAAGASTGEGGMGGSPTVAVDLPLNPSSVVLNLQGPGAEDLSLYSNFSPSLDMSGSYWKVRIKLTPAAGFAVDPAASVQLFAQDRDGGTPFTWQDTPPFLILVSQDPPGVEEVDGSYILEARFRPYGGGDFHPDEVRRVGIKFSLPQTADAQAHLTGTAEVLSSQLVYDGDGGLLPGDVRPLLLPGGAVSADASLQPLPSKEQMVRGFSGYEAGYGLVSRDVIDLAAMESLFIAMKQNGQTEYRYMPLFDVRDGLVIHEEHMDAFLALAQKHGITLILTIVDAAVLNSFLHRVATDLVPDGDGLKPGPQMTAFLDGIAPFLQKYGLAESGGETVMWDLVNERGRMPLLSGQAPVMPGQWQFFIRELLERLPANARVTLGDKAQTEAETSFFLQDIPGVEAFLGWHRYPFPGEPFAPANRLNISRGPVMETEIDPTRMTELFQEAHDGGVHRVLVWRDARFPVTPAQAAAAFDAVTTASLDVGPRPGVPVWVGLVLGGAMMGMVAVLKPNGLSQENGRRLKRLAGLAKDWSKKRKRYQELSEDIVRERRPGGRMRKNAERIAELHERMVEVGGQIDGVIVQVQRLLAGSPWPYTGGAQEGGLYAHVLQVLGAHGPGRKLSSVVAAPGDFHEAAARMSKVGKLFRSILFPVTIGLSALSSNGDAEAAPRADAAQVRPSLSHDELFSLVKACSVPIGTGERPGLAVVLDRAGDFDADADGLLMVEAAVARTLARDPSAVLDELPRLRTYYRRWGLEDRYNVLALETAYINAQSIERRKVEDPTKSQVYDMGRWWTPWGMKEWKAYQPRAPISLTPAEESRATRRPSDLYEEGHPEWLFLFGGFSAIALAALAWLGIHALRRRSSPETGDEAPVVSSTVETPSAGDETSAVVPAIEAPEPVSVIAVPAYSSVDSFLDVGRLAGVLRAFGRSKKGEPMDWAQMKAAIRETEADLDAGQRLTPRMALLWLAALRIAVDEALEAEEIDMDFVREGNDRLARDAEAYGPTLSGGQDDFLVWMKDVGLEEEARKTLSHVRRLSSAPPAAAPGTLLALLAGGAGLASFLSSGWAHAAVHGGAPLAGLLPGGDALSAVLGAGFLVGAAISRSQGWVAERFREGRKQGARLSPEDRQHLWELARVVSQGGYTPMGHVDVKDGIPEPSEKALSLIFSGLMKVRRSLGGDMDLLEEMVNRQRGALHKEAGYKERLRQLRLMAQSYGEGDFERAFGLPEGEPSTPQWTGEGWDSDADDEDVAPPEYDNWSKWPFTLGAVLSAGGAGTAATFWSAGAEARPAAAAARALSSPGVPLESVLGAAALAGLLVLAVVKLMPFIKNALEKTQEAIGRRRGLPSGRDVAVSLAEALTAEGAPARSLDLERADGKSSQSVLRLAAAHAFWYRINAGFRSDFPAALRRLGAQAPDMPARGDRAGATRLVVRAAGEQALAALPSQAGRSFLAWGVIQGPKGLEAFRQKVLSAHAGGTGRLLVFAHPSVDRAAVEKALSEADVKASLDFRASAVVPAEGDEREVLESAFLSAAEKWLPAAGADLGVQAGGVAVYAAYPSDMNLVLDADPGPILLAWNVERIRFALNGLLKVQYMNLKGLVDVIRLVAQMA